MSLSCNACGHEWGGEIIDPARLPMPLEEASAAITALVCANPACKAGIKHLRLHFGDAHRADLPVQKYNPESKTWHIP